MHNVGQNALFHVLDAFYWAERPVHFGGGMTRYMARNDSLRGADRTTRGGSTMGRIDWQPSSHLGGSMWYLECPTMVD